MQALNSIFNILIKASPFPGKLIVVGAMIAFAACRHPQVPARLFTKLTSAYTGVTFNNAITESDTANPLNMDFLYHGGGVAAADFNNDGLTDLYFTANQSSNRLYLNKGDLRFQDLTTESKTTGDNRWCMGPTAVDINNDNLSDLYVCASVIGDPEKRRNLLYVNQGISPEGVPVFKEMASEYGLADSSFSIQATFFDADNDGDLDMYLVTSKNSEGQSMRFTGNNNNEAGSADLDKLFRNDFNSTLGHPVFTDVSRQAGIQQHGYGLGVCVADLNNDGWQDIYVTNDYYTSDVLLLNNHNGTFSNKTASSLKHISQNAMGVDIADINNDGWNDILTLDMNPESNYRKKKNMGSNNYFLYQSMLNRGQTLQYIRNTLQLNVGSHGGDKDSARLPLFAEIGFYAGVAATDWSWNASIADVDNDGLKDILITNGYPRDITDHDFWAFRDRSTHATQQEILDQIPSIQVANYGFKNQGSCQFTDETIAWGLEDPSYSNGSVYADLDNDGDLDYVVNNINDEAFVYKNTVNQKDSVHRNFLELSFREKSANVQGIGARVTIFYDRRMQTCENMPVRGYLSSMAPSVFFGLDTVQRLDSILIEWTAGRQMLYDVAVNQRLIVSQSDAQQPDALVEIHPPALFTDQTAAAGIHYIAREPDWIDFNEERLLPHKLSEYGPALGTGDLDNNGHPDLVIGGSGDRAPALLMQMPNGQFREQTIAFPEGKDVRRPESVGVAVFDADNDGDLDLYFANGSNEFLQKTKNYQDRLFLNDGKGGFTWDTAALPINYASKSCVRVCDFDRDGDLDLFIGGRVIPGRYPLPASSFLLRNDSRKGQVSFTDVTDSVAPCLKEIGMVCDALWSDFDGDGLEDLVLAGEWMPITFLRNRNGRFSNSTPHSGVQQATGWWNSLAAADVDGDGDIDYFAGNLGQNSFYSATKEEPVQVFAKDFDNNGSLDAVPSLYLPGEDGKRRPYPAQNRDDIVEQLPGLKKKFLTYKSFARATISDLFSPSEMQGALVLQASEFRSAYFENLGSGKFRLHALPWQAQLAPVYGMLTGDYNGDGYIDLLVCGNDYGTEVAQGRYDALNGLVLIGNGTGQFSVMQMKESGIYIPGNARSLVQLHSPSGKILVAAVQNRGPVLLFSLNR